jgi:hypothetical protein
MLRLLGFELIWFSYLTRMKNTVVSEAIPGTAVTHGMIEVGNWCFYGSMYLVGHVICVTTNENMWPQPILLVNRFRSLWHIYCQGGGWYKYGGCISNFLSTVIFCSSVYTQFHSYLWSFLSSFLFIRLQVDEEEDECYDDDYPYDTDDSNGNCGICQLVN